MYELKTGSHRLVSALYNRIDDPQTLWKLAQALDYMPEQLQQDIQALSDTYQMLEETQTLTEDEYDF